jgi:hypothetical protein
VADRLPVDVQLPGDPPGRPVEPVKSQYRLYVRHIELIRHLTVRSFFLKRTNRKQQISLVSKWLVLKRPRLAGFRRPVTKEGIVFFYAGSEPNVHVYNLYSALFDEGHSPFGPIRQEQDSTGKFSPNVKGVSLIGSPF